MSSVAKFYERLAADQGLQKELQAATAAAAETAIVGIAGAQGFVFTVDDLRSHMAAQAEELNEEDLARVTGGLTPSGPLLAQGAFLNQIGMMTGGLVAGGGLLAGGGLPGGGFAMNDKRCDSRCRCA